MKMHRSKSPTHCLPVRPRLHEIAERFFSQAGGLEKAIAELAKGIRCLAFVEAHAGFVERITNGFEKNADPRQIGRMKSPEGLFEAIQGTQESRTEPGHDPPETACPLVFGCVGIRLAPPVAGTVAVVPCSSSHRFTV